MTDPCALLADIDARREMVAPDELEELLFAAGFRRVRVDDAVGFYTHPNGVRVSIRVQVPGLIAAGTVREAIGAVREVVVCDDG